MIPMKPLGNFLLRRAAALPLLAAAGQLVGVAAFGAAPIASTFVDDQGVLRWTGSHAEVAQFGVNYTVPFAYSFRAHKALGIPWQRAIDADVYHFARLGFDAYRVHIWDREISDPAGNLVVNEHVQAFDYLLAKLKQRGIKIILTPLQFGDAGYPDVGEPLTGFSASYGKEGCLEDKASWPLQERYLAQLVRHVNPLTGVAYKDDPDLLAFEICNEPGHFDYALTLEYINRMVRALRDAGCTKPIFYNMSHGLPVHQAYLDADVQGGTFQWYPSNLLAGHEQRGNFLPYVDAYPIPFADDPKFRTKAKMIYEFDSADIGRSYIYPAMARSFRTAGMQFATQFAYDPMYLAPFNTEYQTHYLNLAYAPQKALSLKIAGEAFRRVPLHHRYGRYPDDTSFEGVRVSYVDDLAELVTDTEFFYTNTTATRPPAPAALEEVAGYGRSPVVSSPGQGAYFVDRLAPGVWRLELMPDAIWVRDPFEPASPKKQVARIAWNDWPVHLALPDLGDDFSATGLNPGNDYVGRASAGTLTLGPGAYLLVRQGVTTSLSAASTWRNITLGEFVAPPPSIDRTYVLHQPLVEASTGHDLTVAAKIVAPRAVSSVDLIAYLPPDPALADRLEQPDPQAQPGKGNRPGPGATDLKGAQIFPLRHIAGFDYEAVIPAALLHAGPLRYHIVVQTPSGSVSFPSDLPGRPTDWDFSGQPWQTRLVDPAAPVLLFAAASDANQVTAQKRDVRYELVPSDLPGTSAMAVIARDLTEEGHDHSCRFFFADKIAGRRAELGRVRQLVFHGRSATSEPCRLQLALVSDQGVAYGAMVTVSPEGGTYTISLRDLKQVRSPNIPHGYPVFIPFWSEVGKTIPFDVTHAESVLVSIGPGLAEPDYHRVHGVNLERVWLE